MKKKPSTPKKIYRGRFAPSPTGPLHFGSLVAAVGSYIDAKYHHGTWLVRMEDLDTPRCVPGAAKDILRTLEVFGLHSDEPILYQSQRTSAYKEVLSQLQSSGAVYPCSCTRKEITDSALHGIEGLVYPGTCRNGIPAGREARAWRVRTDLSLSVHPELDEATSHSTKPASGQVAGYIEGRKRQNSKIERSFDKLSPNGSVEFTDALQGRIAQNLEREIGDFVVRRADGFFAYQLAVVVDDAFQGITHIVRGADLLASTVRQIYLQHLLEFTNPTYMHLPVALNAAGEKLSKQTLATPVDTSQPVATLLRVLDYLQQQPPAALADSDASDVLAWAIQHWDVAKLRGVHSLTAPVIP